MPFHLSQILLRRIPGLSRLFHGYETWILLDIPLILGAFLLALLLRSITANVDLVTGALFSFAIVLTFLVANVSFGIYRRYWSYASVSDAMALIGASVLATSVVLMGDLLLQPRPVPVSTVLMGGFFALTGQLVARYRRRMFSGARWALRNSLARLISQGTPTLILGAGESGQSLAHHLQMSGAGAGYRLLGFLDDDPDKVGKIIHGLPVLGRCDQVQELVEAHQVELVVIAIHNVPKSRFRQLVDRCMETDARIRILPDPLESIRGQVDAPWLREVAVTDLLGRTPHHISREPIRAMLQGRTVLVTGACGSIGSELARQILAAQPARLILLDNNESGMHELALELGSLLQDRQTSRLVPVIGDVTLRSQIEHLFQLEQPHIVFHAAAYKHVSWMERHPLQAVRVNVLGTHIVHSACLDHGAERFVLISTDKAVDPTSIMGATKRLCELLVLTFDRRASSGNGAASGSGGCRSTVVRFGNVLGSRGSVIPTFERQIEQGGPVTITDPRMRRFFMSLDEAASLVLVAATLTRGGDVFMLEMGEEVRIVDLANRMIRLRGLRPQVDVPIVCVGKGPGEKLSEILLGVRETSSATEQPGIFRVHTPGVTDPELVSQGLERLEAYLAAYDEEAVVDFLWALLSRLNGAPLSGAIQEETNGQR